MTGWWFGTFCIFPYIGNNPSHQPDGDVRMFCLTFCSKQPRESHGRTTGRSTWSRSTGKTLIRRDAEIVYVAILSWLYMAILSGEPSPIGLILVICFFGTAIHGYTINIYQPQMSTLVETSKRSEEITNKSMVFPVTRPGVNKDPDFSWFLSMVRKVSQGHCPAPPSDMKLVRCLNHLPSSNQPWLENCSLTDL